MAELEVIARSPCLGDCNPNDKGICLSCFLSTKENDQWNNLTNQERLVIVKNTELRKQAHSEGKPFTEIGIGSHD
jgi:predicted Fe-S protein YdhL (DUF1289 family)